jgi:hypothetical protein
MLKITAVDNSRYRTLVLEGKLVDPWIAELERVWHEVRHSETPRTLLVDLKDVTVISQHGENVLLEMMNEGAQFNCCRGVLTRRVVEGLERRRRGNDESKRSEA